MPVLHPQRSATRLVQADVTLTDELIARIIQLHVPHAWVKHPLLKDLDGLILSQVPEQRRAIYDTIKAGFDQLQNRVITTNDYQRYRKVIAALITELLGRTGKAGDLAERLFNDGDELASHCSNVAYLAVTVGMQLESYVVRQRGRGISPETRDLTSLGVGAMLHDLGKLKSPREARVQHENSIQRHPEYARHTLDGYEILRHRINPLASTIALHHHQHWDGHGWPDMTNLTHGRHIGGLRGPKIHIFARIVAVANAFDNLCTRPDRTVLPAIFALHSLQTDRFRGQFDPTVLDAFLRYLPPFPTGAEVILSDNRVAAVTSINPDQPCRPKVRPLGDESDGADIDLLHHPDLYIRESQGHDVTRWLYELKSRSETLRATEPIPVSID